MLDVATWRGFARHALDLALPARCLKCGEIVAGAAGLCAQCWPSLRLLGEPCCECCGQPFEFAEGAGARCAQCLSAPPPFARARAALRYDSESRDLVLRFKHADRADAAPMLAGMMARAGSALLEEAEFLVPVPLHWARLWRRRYNQAALLARELATFSGKSCLTRVLKRARATASQGRLGRLARGRNVAGAFRVAHSAAAKIAGRHLLLVDDVLTTGATAQACTEALLEAGAVRVDVLTLARVVRA